MMSVEMQYEKEKYLNPFPNCLLVFLFLIIPGDDR